MKPQIIGAIALGSIAWKLFRSLDDLDMNDGVVDKRTEKQESSNDIHSEDFNPSQEYNELLDTAINDVTTKLGIYYDLLMLKDKREQIATIDPIDLCIGNNPIEEQIKIDKNLLKQMLAERDSIKR